MGVGVDGGGAGGGDDAEGGAVGGEAGECFGGVGAWLGGEVAEVGVPFLFGGGGGGGGGGRPSSVKKVRSGSWKAARNWWRVSFGRPWPCRTALVAWWARSVSAMTVPFQSNTSRVPVGVWVMRGRSPCGGVEELVGGAVGAGVVRTKPAWLVPLGCDAAGRRVGVGAVTLGFGLSGFGLLGFGCRGRGWCRLR